MFYIFPCHLIAAAAQKSTRENAYKIGFDIIRRVRLGELVVQVKHV
ncbi:hypothetical protein CHCC14814_3222 [Bacillus paralicheniformis]|nr:hypothetical protein CHCC14814_3222 [Bacillus paralicheniformis]